MNYNNIAKAQSKAIKNKATSWRYYLQDLTKELNSGNTYYLFRATSLWASTFSYIEWLVVFHLYKTFPSRVQIAKALKKFWGWDQKLGGIFWAAGRHPVAHIGQANAFYSYADFNGLPTNVLFDSSNRWSKAVTGEWDKYHPFKGVAILPPLDTGDEKVQVITFFHQMILAELLPKLAAEVVKQIANESNPDELQKICELNKQILH